jgi:hypothetical protein
MIGLLLRLLGLAPARPRPARGARRTAPAPGRGRAAAPTWRPLSGKEPERLFPAKAQWPRGR